MKKICLFTFLVVFLSAFTAWQVRLWHRSLLLSKAAPLADLSQFYLPSGHHQWLSQTEVCFFTRKHNDYTALVLDVRSGNVAYLTNVTSVLSRLNANNKWPHDSSLGLHAIISPDGRALVGYFRSNQTCVRIFVPTFGSNYLISVSPKLPYRTFWRPNSDSWIELFDFQTNRVWSCYLYETNSLKSKQIQMPAYNPIGFINHDTFALTSKNTNNPRAMSICIVDLHDGIGRVIQDYSMALPHRLTFWRACLSPKQDRILWILVTRSKSWRFDNDEPFPAIQEVKQNAPSLWISDVDGKNLRELGQFAIGGDSVDFDFSWTVDANKVTFPYKKKLYAISIQ